MCLYDFYHSFLNFGNTFFLGILKEKVINQISFLKLEGNTNWIVAVFVLIKKVMV